MGCSSSTQTQAQEGSRPVTKTGVTNGLKQRASSDGNSSITYEKEICLDKTKRCAVEAKVNAHEKTGPTNDLPAVEPTIVEPLATDGPSSTCEEGYPGKAESAGSRERAQAEYMKSTDKAKNSGVSEESVPPISIEKNELSEIDEKDDKEIEKGTQPTDRFVETEILGTVKEIEPLGIDRETEPMETEEHNHHRALAEEADPQRTMEVNKQLVTSEEIEHQETLEDVLHIDTDRKPARLEENDYVGTDGETKLSGTHEETEHEETVGKTEPSEIPKESEGSVGEAETLGALEVKEHEGTSGENKPSEMMKKTEHDITAKETEPSGTPREFEGIVGEAETSGALEEKEHEGERKSSETIEKIECVITNGETELSGTHEESEHEGIAGETNISGMMEESEHEGTIGEPEPIGTMEKTTQVTGEKNILQETVEDNELQPFGASEKNVHSRTVRGTELPKRVEKIQFVETVGGTKPPIIDEGTQENMKPLLEVARKINMNEKDQAIEGETGERVETETHSEIVSETKEEETGEAVDTSAAKEIELTNSKK
ncbi:glutamate-rich protein 5 [Macrotis lagotis]|uniref:glutamate-rich protein 5 n=1 Tax=Macrotis lagotis TaxID=92651 RepID=UPI003D691A7C